MGGGLRLKSLTALSSGLAVVSTPLGVEGLQVRKGKEYLEAISSQAFADAIVSLLKDPKRRRQMEINARLYAQAYHGKALNTVFLKQYKQLVDH
jgi:glycosyltransferase involved in cell wall biosynthesis